MNMVNKYQSEMQVDSESIFRKLLQNIKFEEMPGFDTFKNDTNQTIKSELDKLKNEIETIKADVYELLDNCNRDLLKVNSANDLIMNKF